MSLLLTLAPASVEEAMKAGFNADFLCRLKNGNWSVIYWSECQEGFLSSEGAVLVAEIEQLHRLPDSTQKG